MPSSHSAASVSKRASNIASTSSNAPIHIFNGFQNPHGGSELEALSLFDLLREQNATRLWATSSRVSRELLHNYPIRRITPWVRDVPRGGIYVFVGVHWRNKLWPYLIAKPSRLIYIYNTFHPKILTLTAQPPRALGWPGTEYVVISDFQKNLLALRGNVQVHPSPIDISLFSPAARARGARVIIGRMSRDTEGKHDPADLALYRHLVQQGCDIHLQGATCIQTQLGGTPGITVLAEGHFAAVDFLRGLDIFYYRTGTHVETFGRVVFEAMACAKAVVCHAHGGYAESIRHGENGFLFNTTAEAEAILTSLIADPELCARVGAAARATVERMYVPSAVQARLDFYRQMR
jgi:glycosyltransferase involved in cell wall biosynthesis